jgi:hypothetical protein
MFLYISNTDRSDDIIRNTIAITDDIREKPNSCKFKMKGTKPSYYQNVKAFAGFKILSAGADSVTLDAEYRLNENNLFAKGNTVYVAIGETDEETAVIQSISSDDGNIKLTMTANFDNIPSAGEQCGKKMFAGSIVDIFDQNIGTLKTIEFSITCIDYTRIFDKKLVNDSYVSRDSRYIINDFCNNTINYNQPIDEIEYADNAAIQAAWTEADDGSAPVISTDYQEGTVAGRFAWVNAGGTATFESTPIASNITPLSDRLLGFWYKCADYTKVTSFKVLIGSDNANYAEIEVIPSSNDWTYHTGNLETVVGAPDWSAVNYLAISVTETANSFILFDGFRVLEDNFFRHYPYVLESSDFANFNISRTKPTETLQKMAESLNWFWYIDYDRYIHFFPQATNSAPFNLNETSNNFDKLKITYDSSKIINRQVIEGGNETSTSFYSQVFEGDGFTRTFLLKNLFSGLKVGVDDNSANDPAEVGTDPTTIIITAHGLEAGDYIINRTRSNAVREVLTVPDADTFTVATVTDQTDADTISYFTQMDVGVEGINEDAGYDYMSNYWQKSIRSSVGKDTLTSGEFLLAQYNEVVPILVQRHDITSSTLMKSILGHTDGIFDGQVIKDETIKSRAEAVQLADATINKYSNVLIDAEFDTYKGGLKSGQIINIKDTANGTRNINQSFMIQQVKIRELESGYLHYEVTAASTLYGLLELFIQLLKQGRKIRIDEDVEISNIFEAQETISVSDSFVSAVDGNKHAEIVTVSDSMGAVVFTPPFKFMPDPSNSKFNLASFS